MKTEAMDSHHIYEVEIYSSAGHAYMRNGDNPEGSEAIKKGKILLK